MMSLKTASKDFRPSIDIAGSPSLHNCSISFKDFILPSGSVSIDVPSSASLNFFFSLDSSTERSFSTSA